jgi:RNA polymerase sigma-70 factor (ECF subfamily)
MGPTPRATLDESPQAAREVRRAVARCKRGDRDALRLLYERYAGNVYGYIRSIVKDDKEAEDLTQHVFLKLITAIAKYDDRGIPFSGWLLRLARNVALDHLRRRRPIPAEEVFGADRQSDETALHHAGSLRAALVTLPDEQRTVVVMRHLVGLTPAEIATRMGRSESSVHGLHHRGRRALQQELRRLDSAPSTAAAAV